ncbi:glycosyltransferase family 4 protein [Flavobacteriaceae bacterium XHP0103]|uniref:glycosyltransferase family 4 protein n=1 Tax=Marixanthotalea marina TaxID=2844359 RepID=UPI002989B984|nr:glycosyltransferase family 4 protein [Marixanthotalea marina]MBU3822721.1 glycosyltransferase family 4 protein [Marixanthotalea marina]
MKHLLYIGNQLSGQGKTSTTVDTLSVLLRSEGYKVFTASNKKYKLWRLIDMLFHIIKFAKQVDYVLIDTYSTQNFYYVYLSGKLCRLLRLKYIPILHGGNLENRLKNSPTLCRNLFGNAYINVAPSKFTENIFSQCGYSNLVCIPNTIEIKNYPFKERSFKEVNLLWVRSFSKIYNPHLAIKILKALKEEGVKASLCMVGPESDGSLNEVKNFAKQLNIDVKFTGKLSKQEWIGLSNDYNIFINTTNYDNMPVSVIEAMALGLPVISTNVGGLPFLIDDNKDGILINPNSVFEFVVAIKKIMAEPSKAFDMTLQARKRVKGFDWDVVKRQWIDLLN